MSTHPVCCSGKTTCYQPQEEKTHFSGEKPTESGLSKEEVKKIVEQKYCEIVSQELETPFLGCDCVNKGMSKAFGYTDEELSAFPEANLGLGCGHPVGFGKIEKGDTVLDLGSGAGIDVFLAARVVGETGFVIGVDMTQAMIDKAKENAVKYGFKNVDFRKGEIEDLPVESNSVNKIISNCVVNLATDKAQVFREALRVLKPEGRMYISDIVLLEELSEEIRTNPELISGCVSNAMLRDQFLELIESCGLKYNIIEEDREISKKQYKGIALESLKLEIYKPAAVVVDSTTKV